MKLRVLTWMAAAALAWCEPVTSGSVPRFLPDDPLWQEPPPRSAAGVQPNHFLNIVDFYKNTFHKKGERNSAANVHPSEGINTLGEVPDGAWYTNRHWRTRMSLEELARGPHDVGPPDTSGVWTVVAAKSEGVTPGFTIEDARGRRYLLKFDPKKNPELVTAADVISARFLYAFGYWVPENYIVRFRFDQLRMKPGVKFTDRFRRVRDLQPEDIKDLLGLVPRLPDGRYRAMASLYIAGKLVGGFKYYARRAGDPNEFARHEHMRVLRGLYVFAAWLNHTDAKALNTLDTLVEDRHGVPYIRHYLIDFGASLGSDSLFPKDPRLGHEYMIDFKPGLVELATLGAKIPPYARARYPKDPAVGNINVKTFDPEHWKTNYPNAAFENRLPGDEFWAAKQVMALTDEEIRAVVNAGEFSNPETARQLADILIQRRDKVGRTFFAKLLPLDNFRVENGRLRFDDLAAKYGFAAPQRYSVEWERWDNLARRQIGNEEAGTEALTPAVASLPEGSYACATVRGSPPGRSIRVFLRNQEGGWTVVGLEREGANAWRER